jgi:hypothetical protein
MKKVYLLEQLNTDKGFDLWGEKHGAFTSIKKIEEYISWLGMSEAFSNICFLKTNPVIADQIPDGPEHYAHISILTERSIQSKEYLILRPIPKGNDEEDDEVDFKGFTFIVKEIEMNPKPWEFSEEEKPKLSLIKC